MEQNTTPVAPANNGKGMGTAGMIIGIVSVVLAIIPCLGMWAIIPAIVGIILSALSMKQAGNGPKGMAVTGLICSVVAIAIAAYWIYAWYALAHAVSDNANLFKDAMESSGAMDSLNKAMEEFKHMADTLQQH